MRYGLSAHNVRISLSGEQEKHFYPKKRHGIFLSGVVKIFITWHRGNLLVNMAVKTLTYKPFALCVCDQDKLHLWSLQFA